MILEFSDIPVLPKPQSTGRTHHYQKKSYHKYSADLANIIRAKYNNMLLIHPPINPKKPILLHVWYYGKDTGDKSNLYKAIEDACSRAMSFNDRKNWSQAMEYYPSKESKLIIQIQNIER